MTIREKRIEKHLVNLIRARGGLCLKFVSPGTQGVPDRIIIANQKIVFVELKAPGEKPRPAQTYMINKLTQHGATVYIADSLQAVERITNEICTA